MTNHGNVTPHAPNKRVRYAFLDAARAMAALSVMLQHSLEASGIASLTVGSVATSWLNLGETGVGIFFLISGFIIPASVHGTSTFVAFWIRRVFRIYPLYLAVFAFTLSLSVLLIGNEMPPVGRTVVSHLLLLQPWLNLPNYVGGAWTLLIEMVWYASFSFAFFLGIARGTRLIVLFLIAYAIVIVLAAFLYSAFPFGRLSIFALCFLGYLYLLRAERQIEGRYFAILLSTFVILISASLVVGFYVYPSPAAEAPNFTCVAISWTLAMVFFPLMLANSDSAFATSSILSFLGEISFSLYLIHSPVMLVLVQAGLSGIPFIVATFAATTLISVGTFRYIESPFIALARRMTRRPSQRAVTV